jgi:ArsR family transcriptional regulator, cadmium/lead-responsive transcriptional repressor
MKTVEVTAERIAAATDPFRRHILEVLMSKGECSVTVVAEGMPISRQAVSKHLALLLRLGLVESRHSGRETLFHVCTDVLDEVVAEIRQSALTWERRLKSLKGIAESS